jgi:hypothetical protein
VKQPYPDVVDIKPMDEFAVAEMNDEWQDLNSAIS